MGKEKKNLPKREINKIFDEANMGFRLLNVHETREKIVEQGERAFIYDSPKGNFLVFGIKPQEKIRVTGFSPDGRFAYQYRGDICII